jgi:hypothetical protein
MKNAYIILMSAAITMSTAYSQNNLSFKFGLPISLAQVLLKDKTINGWNFTPTISCGYFSLSETDKETGGGSTETESMGVHLFIPRVGLRTPLKVSNVESSLKRYAFADVFKVFPVFTGSNAKELQEDFNDQNLYGLIAGSGVEYFFAKDFSLGGEFSMNLFVNSWEHEQGGNSYYNEVETITHKTSLRAGAIFTQFTLNYYFK